MRVTCPYCNVPANCVDSTQIYGSSYGMIWLCSNYPTCDARVGARGPQHRPLGTLARQGLRDLRKTCHAKFDPLWKNGEMTRSQAYEFLQKIMGLMSPGAAHIAMFDEERCLRLLSRIDCSRCVDHPGEFGPSHEGSRACRNANKSLAAGGTATHCTCSGCF